MPLPLLFSLPSSSFFFATSACPSSFSISFCPSLPSSSSSTFSSCRFQACLYFAAAFQAVACGIHYLASVFLVETPNFVCAPPGNVTDVLYGNLTGSWLEDLLPAFRHGHMVAKTSDGRRWVLSRCRRALHFNTTNFSYVFDGNKTEVGSCDTGNFVYDHSEVQQSIVTDWDLVCEREWLAKLCQPTFMLGVLIGALVFGDLADR